MTDDTEVFTTLSLMTEAQLTHRDHTRHYVSWNHVNCCMNVWKLVLEKACKR